MNEKTGRKSGIVPVGEVSWGTHLCLFYQTKQDLIDILAPYFKAGLENNEFCMWITSEPLSAKDAKRSLERVVKDLDSYIENGQLEILDYSHWYTKAGRFEADKVMQAWIDKENQAVQRGFAGLRLTGNTFWLEKEDWDAFADYEATINRVIGQYHMLAICTYSLDRCGATEVIEVVSNHQFALIKQQGEWEVIESAELKQSGEALRESQRKLRLIAENTTDVIFAYDMDRRLIYVNPALEEFTGYTVAELEEKNFINWLYPEDEAKMMALWEGLFAGKGFSAEESRIVTKDGQIKWCLSSWEPLYDETGQQIGVRGRERDITERKQAEEALRESEEKLRMLFEQLPIGVTLLGQNRKVIYTNPAIERTLDLSRDDLLRGEHQNRRYIRPDGTPMPPEEFASTRALREQRAVRDVEIGVITESGRTIWTSVSAAPFPVAGKGVLVTTADITERRRAEDALRESEERFRSILDNIQDGYFEVDTAGNFVFFNPALVRILGRPSNELMGMNNRLYMTPEGGKAVFQIFNRIFRTGIPEQALDWGLVRPDGTLRSVEASVSLIKAADGSTKGFRGTVRDITERKRAEEALRQSHERFQLVNRATFNVIWDWNLQTDALWWNENIQTTFGYRAEEIEPSIESWTSRIHPQDLDRVKSSIRAAIDAGQQSWSSQYRFRRRDGTYAEVDDRGYIAREASGNPLRMIGAMQDITERKRAEDAVRESEQKYRQLFDLESDALFLIERDNGRILEASAGATALYGYSHDEWLTMRNVDVSAEPEGTAAATRDAVTEIPIRWHRKKDGTIIPVDIRATHFEWQGRPVHLAAIRDITERKRAEEALRKKDEHHRNVVERIFRFVPEGLLVFTENLSLVKQNKAFEEITQQYAARLGYAEQELAELIAEQVRRKILSGDTTEIHIPKKRC